MNDMLKIFREYKIFKANHDNYSFEERQKIRADFRKRLAEDNNEPMQI